LSFFNTDLSGQNTFAFPRYLNPTECVSRAVDILNSSAPTRILLLLPATTEHKFLAIAQLKGSSLSKALCASENYTLALAINKESMHRDPVNWAAVVERLQEWCPEVDIPKSTDSLFRERVAPTHLPRSLPLNGLTRQLRADIPGVFSFHRPHAHAVDAKQLRRANLPPIVSSALIKINRHKFSLLALGILPNELRKLVRKENADSEACLDHLRKIFFWGSYRIWKTRKALVTSYWESLEASKVKPKRKRRGQCESGCKSSFHFLVKSVDLSKQRLTLSMFSHHSTVDSTPTSGH